MTSLESVASPDRAVVSAAIKPQQVHLLFLDGLRGFAALYVLLFHAYMLLMLRTDVSWRPGWFAHLTNPLGYGHYAVAVFIVLSGYCLMLPVVRTEGYTLRGGVKEFVRRRAWRILPPYYAALALCLALVMGSRLLHLTRGQNAELSAGSILSHILMLHNLSFAYANSIDPPMWSVATEWDIYFLFALILLPLWRQFGKAASLLAAFAIPFALHTFLPARYNLDWAYFEYLSLFALGMIGAEITHGKSLPCLNNIAFWLAGALVTASSLAALALVFPRNVSNGYISGLPVWSSDLLAGICALSVIVLLALQRRKGKISPLARVLESSPAMRIGAFSYSLYLIHQPILDAALKISARLHLPPPALWTLTYLIVVPSVIGAAWLFHLAFERPFLTRKK